MNKEDVLDTLCAGRHAASLVFFVDTETGNVLLGKHTRGPFVGMRSGLWGKYEATVDSDMRDCSLRECCQELGTVALQKDHFQLMGVLVCETIWGKHRRVPVYTYACTASTFFFQQDADGMGELWRYSGDDLPAPLKWGTVELIDHLHAWVDELVFFHITNEKLGERMLFRDLQELDEEQYRLFYERIME